MHTAIIAQDAIIGQLRRQWCENRVPHALLLCGPSGLLLCVHPTSQDEKAQPCGTCPSCTLLRTLVHPDLHFVFPVIRPANVSSSTPVTSDLWIQKWREMLSRGAYFDLSEWEQYMNIENQQPAIYAEESDNLLQKVSLVPARGGYRVVIIWLPELMNTTCANKMLKLLEEPPHLCADQRARTQCRRCSTSGTSGHGELYSRITTTLDRPQQRGISRHVYAHHAQMLYGRNS